MDWGHSSADQRDGPGSRDLRGVGAVASGADCAEAVALLRKRDARGHLVLPEFEEWVGRWPSTSGAADSWDGQHEAPERGGNDKPWLRS
jgi:hypothetical protein